MTLTLLTPTQIDSGLHFVGDIKWAGPTLTFSIPDATSVWDAMYNGRADGEPTSPLYSGLSPAQAAAFALDVQLWDSYAALSIVQVDDHVTPGDFRIAFTDVNKYSPGAAGYAYSPPVSGFAASPSAGDTWLPAPDKSLTYAQGTYGFQVLLHEFGHALGLKHPFADPALANGPSGENYNFYTYSVMSYTGADYKHNITVSPNSVSDPNDVVVDLTPMVLDIQAIQDLYGADTTTFAGNTVHRFTDTDFDGRRSLYDASGIDTLDFSQISRGSNIDLRPGAYSDIAYFSKEAQEAAVYAANPQFAQDAGFRNFVHNALNDPNRPDYEWTKNLGIAFSTTIENVIGTAKADTIIGNTVANVFTGGAGADVYTGNGGNDVFRDTAANLSGDRVTDFINADIVTVTDAVGALLNLSYSGSVLSFALATAPLTAYTMTLNGASGTVNQRPSLAGGVDIYFGTGAVAPVYAIAVSPSSALEGDSGVGNALTYTVTRTGDTSAATIDVGLSGTANAPGTAGADYSVNGLTAGKLAFAAGATSASFTVTTAPDTTVEPDETVIATISNATGGGTIGTASASGTITNDDVTAPPVAPSYSMVVSPTSVAEGDSGPGNVMTFTVTRAVTTNAVTLGVSFSGTATAPGSAGSDYTVDGLSNGQLAFAAGAASASFTVKTTPDTTVEPNETVIATISDRAGGDTPLAVATGTISNDDAAPPAAPVYSIAVAPASALEGDTGAGHDLVYTVTRTGGTAAATIDAAFTGTATAPGSAGADYGVSGLTNGHLAFAAGATTASFTVTTVPDKTVEANETVIATLSNATGGGTITTASATGTITNDDAAPPAAPTPVLITDTGTSNTDTITKNPAISYPAPATGDVLLYSRDAGPYTATAPVFATDGTQDGAHTVSIEQRDPSGNVSGPSTLSFTLDTIVPTAVLAPSDPTATAAGTVHYAVTISEGVTGLDSADFQIATTGTLAGTAITGVTQTDASHYSVSVSTGSGEGTVSLTLAAAGSGVSDVAGNLLAADAAGAAYTVTLNRAPIANPDSQLVAAYSTRSGSVLLNDTDQDGDPLSVTSIALAGGGATAVPAGGATISGAHGTLTVAIDGHYTYAASKAGQDIFSYDVSDGHGSTASTTLTLSIDPDNAAFAFVSHDATMTYAHNQALLTGPDGVVRDVTGIGHLQFTDGTIDAKNPSAPSGTEAFDYTVGNGHPYFGEVQTFDDLNRVTRDQVNFADGHEQIAIRDAANLQPWTTNNLLTDNLGKLSVNQLIYDDGHQAIQFNDTANFQPWATNNLLVDAAGRVAVNQLIYDDGRQAIAIKDVANAQPWAVNNLLLDPAGKLAVNQLIYDDGHQEITINDVANTQPYASNSILLDSKGVQIANSVVYDDGHVTQWHI